MQTNSLTSHQDFAVEVEISSCIRSQGHLHICYHSLTEEAVILPIFLRTYVLIIASLKYVFIIVFTPKCSQTRYTHMLYEKRYSNRQSAERIQSNYHGQGSNDTQGHV